MILFNDTLTLSSCKNDSSKVSVLLFKYIFIKWIIKIVLMKLLLVKD